MAALRLQLADQPAAFGRHQRAGPDRSEGARDIDRGALGAAGIEFGDDLQNAGAGQDADLGGKARRAAVLVARPNPLGEDAHAPERYLPNARCHCSSIAAALYGPVNGS